MNLLDEVILKTAVRSELLTRTLVKGTLTAGLGILLMLYAIFLPVSQLSSIGYFIFFLSIGLITLGMLKYRRLQRIERFPITLKGNSDGFIIERKGLLLLQVSWNDVLDIRYRDKSAYGIEVIFKEKFSKKSPFQQDSNLLFLPYFTLRSFKKLEMLYLAVRNRALI